MGEARDVAHERLTRLWDEHSADIAAFVRRRAVGDDVDDVLAETFLVAWRRIEEVPAQARPWLFGVARRVLLDQARARGRAARLAVRIAQQPAEASAGPESAVEEWAVLGEAWRRLHPADQEVLALAVWDQLSAPDAAVVLGVSTTAYRVRLSRARHRFEELVASA